MNSLIDGVALIDKPAGMTSFGVVARVRRVLTQQQGKRVKVGHTGTLDPFATGLMILVIGKERKNAERYSKLDKIYEATITLGKTSSTGDPEGEMTAVNEMQPSRGLVKQTLAEFTGEITQTPPIYSAIKVGGVRAYKLARKGETVDIPERVITVYSLDLIDYTYPELKIRTHVSSGTYIRTLATDIGERLGTGAFTTELRRLTVGEHTINDAQSLSELGIES